MEEAQRWSVTYTKHVQQKRKVYHDGFLVIQSSRNKVMLYDEWDKLLETRFVKKDDLIVSGGTVTFGSYLVDLGELCQGRQPKCVLTSQNQDKKVSETSNSFYGYNSQNRKPMVGKRKGRGLNISPSQKMIRDFKKSEMNKVSSSPNSMDMTNLSTKEWQVLYTTQLTQKAKKFHDGFLQLIVRGSQGRQVKLYDINRRHLDGRFLKRDEIVSSGESLLLDGHLVEVGEQEKCKSPTDLNIQGKSCIVVGKSGIVDYQAKIPIDKQLTAGKTPVDNSQGGLTKLSDSRDQIENARLSRRDAEPKRSVYDIMSNLKQPSGRKENPVNKSFAEGCTESHSAEFQSDTKNHIKECAEESSITAGNELREKVLEHDSMIKVKIEPVDKVTIDVDELAVSENERVPQARSSSFHARPEAVNSIFSTPDVQSINLNKFKSSSSSMKSNAAFTATTNGDIRKEKVSESLTRSFQKQELENPSIIYTCEQVATESNASSFCKLPEVQHGKERSSSRGNSDYASGLKERRLKEDLNKQDTDEFPSFDLGIL